MAPGSVVIFDHKNNWELNQYSAATLREDWTWDLESKTIENGSIFMVLECNSSDGGYARVIGVDRKRFMLPLKYLSLI